MLGHSRDCSVWSTQNPQETATILHPILETRKLTRTLRFGNVPKVIRLACQKISFWQPWPGADNRILAKDGPVQEPWVPSPFTWSIGWMKGMRCLHTLPRSTASVRCQFTTISKSFQVLENGLTICWKWNGLPVGKSEMPITEDVQVGTVDMECTDTWSLRQNSSCQGHGLPSKLHGFRVPAPRW